MDRATRPWLDSDTRDARGRSPGTACGAGPGRSKACRGAQGGGGWSSGSTVYLHRCVGRETKGMIAIREGALVVVAPPGGSVSFTIDQLDQAEAYRRGSPALRPDTLRGDRSIVVTAASATHACASGCRRQVAAHHFVCPDCWWRLPPALRDTITATGGDPDAHVEAMLCAIAWYREELPRAPIGDRSSVRVECAAVPADPPWPRIIEGRCSWCGDAEYPRS